MVDQNNTSPIPAIDKTCSRLINQTNHPMTPVLTKTQWFCIKCETTGSFSRQKLRLSDMSRTKNATVLL